MEINIDDVEIIERYLILLLGSVDRAIPSPEHLQKEIYDRIVNKNIENQNFQKCLMALAYSYIVG